MFDKKYLDLITLDKFKNYLKLNNWVQNVSFPNKNLLVFNKIYDDTEFDIVIPSKEKFKDFKSRIYDSINILSDLEEIDIMSIIHEILSQKSVIKDTFSIRLISDAFDDGTISLETAKNAIDGIKKLITSAVLTEDNPIPYIKGYKKDSLEVINHFALGQTSIGSYIFNIEIENSNLEQVFISNDSELISTSKERRVISRIQNGINNIVNIEYDDEKYKLLLSEGYIHGLNANMCDALLQFNNVNDNLKIETSVTWGSDSFIPKEVPQKVIIHPKDFFTLADISSEYKEVKPKIIEVTGDIISLFHEKDERIVTISTKCNNRKSKLKIKMNYDDYIKSCNAHANEKKISIKGELKKIGKFTYINNYSKLVILDDNTN